MSAYSIVNLKKEVEDSMGERAPGIEGRFARKHLDSEHLGISYLRYSRRVRSPSAHSHREQEEAYVVISGSGQVRLDDEIRELRCWDVVRVNPATVRASAGATSAGTTTAIGQRSAQATAATRRPRPDVRDTRHLSATYASR